MEQPQPTTKDKKWLNSKWWYRLLKITFVFVFVIFQALTYIIVYSAAGNREISHYTFEEIGAAVKVDPAYKTVKSSGSKATADEIQNALNVIRARKADGVPITASEYTDYDLGKLVESKGSLYKAYDRYGIEPKYVDIHGPWEKASYNLAAFLAVSVLFMGLRSAFLYVAIGNAKKTA